jgi:glycosyltransferase involved in cell wall biosynthesis
MSHLRGRLSKDEYAEISNEPETSASSASSAVVLIQRRHQPTMEAAGVSFVVPVRNGASLIRDTLESIVAQADGRPLEIIIVDDGSVDGSAELVELLASMMPIRLVRRHGSGAAAAINAGVRSARYPIICQVDQDVRLQADWMRTLAAELDDPTVAAAQGYFATDPQSSVCARVMGLDLEQRYAAIGRDTDHVCTGNSAYRAEALHSVGLFDETLGYGYDNDMSYRLRAAGYRLSFCPAARSVHRWREGLVGYLRQQYGFGYGRIDLVAKYPRRLTGDRVSPPAMMIHPVVMIVAVAAFIGAALSALGGRSPGILASAGVTLVAALAIERVWAGGRAARRFGDWTALLFPALHLMRDLAWVAAMLMWLARRLRRSDAKPAHSMRPRIAENENMRPRPAGRRGRASFLSPFIRSETRVIGLIPAYNEAANLQSVVADVMSRRPDIELLVIDDGSSDDTAAVLGPMGVRAIHFPERMGIGSAMRAGLGYAVRLGFNVAVRLDGDGQHGAGDIDALLAPIYAGTADVVLGTRYGSAGGGRGGAVRFMRLPLATCLTALTGRRVTDPTSGFCAFGPEAVRLLATHHPNGYAEPELRLFLSRNGLRVLEVPVRARSRLSGRTSLTPARVFVAAARVLLAMLIVPLRAAIKVPRA